MKIPRTGLPIQSNVSNSNNHKKILHSATNIVRILHDVIMKSKKGSFLALLGIYIIFVQSMILTNIQKEIFGGSKIKSDHRPNPRIIHLVRKEVKLKTNNNYTYNKIKQRRAIDIIKSDIIYDSNIDYEDIEYETLSSGKVHDDCVPKEWQKVFYPTCNSMHEINLPLGFVSGNISHLGRGGARDVWIKYDNDFMNDNEIDNKKIILKTMRLSRTADAIKYSSQQIDAMAMERLTSSQYFLDIYSFCGLSTINELATDGDLVKHMSSSKIVSPREKLKYAKDIAHAISDLQTLDDGKNATIVHRDLGPANVMLSDGIAKIIDFNAAFIIKEDQYTHSSCGFRQEICGADGRRADTRSPEECLGSDLTEKIDTYGMGTLFFYLLTNTRVYHCDPNGKNNNNDWYRSRLTSGIGPLLPKHIEKHPSKAIQTIKKAMRYALTFDPEKRPSARMILNFLEGRVKIL